MTSVLSGFVLYFWADKWDGRPASREHSERLRETISAWFCMCFCASRCPILFEYFPAQIAKKAVGKKDANPKVSERHPRRGIGCCLRLQCAPRGGNGLCGMPDLWRGALASGRHMLLDLPPSIRYIASTLYKRNGRRQLQKSNVG